MVSAGAVGSGISYYLYSGDCLHDADLACGAVAGHDHGHVFLYSGRHYQGGGGSIFGRAAEQGAELKTSVENNVENSGLSRRKEHRLFQRLCRGAAVREGLTAALFWCTFWRNFGFSFSIRSTYMI